MRSPRERTFSFYPKPAATGPDFFHSFKASSFPVKSFVDVLRCNWCAVSFSHSLSKLCWGGCFSFSFLSFLGTDFTVPSSSPCSHFPTLRFRFVGRPLHHYNPSPCSSVIKINTLPLFASPQFSLDWTKKGFSSPTTTTRFVQRRFLTFQVIQDLVSTLFPRRKKKLHQL